MVPVIMCRGRLLKGLVLLGFACGCLSFSRAPYVSPRCYRSLWTTVQSISHPSCSSPLFVASGEDFEAVTDPSSTSTTKMGMVDVPLDDELNQVAENVADLSLEKDNDLSTVIDPSLASTVVREGVQGSMIDELKSADDITELSLEQALEVGVNLAIRGDARVLGQVLSSNVKWRGPMGSFNGLAAIESELRGIGAFFSDPRFTVINVDGTSVEWISSVTWPLPWLPRLIVRGSSIVKVEGCKVGE
ncbi:unnamed protein product [Choristocarpus tenellus]